MHTPLYGKLGLHTQTLETEAARIRSRCRSAASVPLRIASTVLHLSALESTFCVDTEVTHERAEPVLRFSLANSAPRLRLCPGRPRTCSELAATHQGVEMASNPIQPMPGRRPVYPADAPAEERSEGERKPGRAPAIAPEGSPEDPASDENTESANHPNDE